MWLCQLLGLFWAIFCIFLSILLQLIFCLICAVFHPLRGSCQIRRLVLWLLDNVYLLIHWGIHLRSIVHLLFDVVQSIDSNCVNLWVVWTICLVYLFSPRLLVLDWNLTLNSKRVFFLRFLALTFFSLTSLCPGFDFIMAILISSIAFSTLHGVVWVKHPKLSILARTYLQVLNFCNCCLT